MTIDTRSQLGRMFGRAGEIWTELDYAQRRLLEIQTGVPVSAQTRATAKYRGRRANRGPGRADRLPTPPVPPAA